VRAHPHVDRGLKLADPYQVGLAGSKLGNYELLAEIARGTTTDLLLARSHGMAGFERHAVIKRVRDERTSDAQFVETFLTEARLAATLHHTNIVQVQDIAQVDGVPFFAMEYVHGGDLRSVLAHVYKAGTWMPIQHVLTIGLAVAAALHHAHEQRSADGKPLYIVHRDVTPSNILIGYDGTVKVLDFGMAKAAITADTQVGVRKGKAPYMAPEQCQGLRTDRRSDVFALGIVLYELVTAHRLFKGASDHDTMTTIVRGTIPPPHTLREDLPRELSSVIMKALARLPADRYQTAADVAGALETYASAAGIAPSPTALATYLKQQLGERKEPWMPGGSVQPPAPVDFDGDQPGAASPAGDAANETPRPRPQKIDINAFAPRKVDKTPIPSLVKPAPAAAKPPEPAKPPAKPFEPAKLFEPAKPPEPARPPAKLFEPVKPFEPAKPFEPVEAADSAAPVAAADPTPSRKFAATTPAKGAPQPSDLAAGWETKVDATMPTRAKELDQKAIDEEMASESSTTELTEDQIQSNLATATLPTRPTPQPVARIALVKRQTPRPMAAQRAPTDDLAIPLEPPPPRGSDDIPTKPMTADEVEQAKAEGAAVGRRAKPRAKSVTSETSPVAGGEIVQTDGKPAKKLQGDLTELVTPLPLELPVSTVVESPRGRPGRRRTMILAGVGGVAVFAAIALVIAFSGGSSRTSQAATASPANDSEARPLPKHLDDDKPATGGQMTWNGVLDAGAGSAEPAKEDPPKKEDPSKEEPPPEEPPNEEPPKEEPVKVVEPAPPPPPSVKKAVVRTAKKPPAPKPHPVAKKPPAKKKPEKPVKYDPNALFLNK
jgi:tRNA A-37 threonylcarbamoyl transferase component Bud32